MFKLQCLLLCVCYLATVSIAGLVPFIDKCKWDDKACLLASSQKAVPYVAAGLSDLGMPPLDPVHLSKVVYNEGGLAITFEDMTLTGPAQCKIKKVERNIANDMLFLEAECPIEVRGTYTASGKILVLPIEGHGPFTVKTNNLLISLKVALKYVDGQDGVKHWQVGKPDYSFDFKEKASLIFENLFNGDKEKSDAIHAIFEENWKDLVMTIGKGIMNNAIDTVVSTIGDFATKVPTSELELPY